MTRPVSTEQPGLFPEPAPVEAVEPDEHWKLSVRLYIEEIEAVASGQLPESLVEYCRDGLIALRGTPEEALVRANQRLRESRAAAEVVIHDAAAS